MLSKNQQKQDDIAKEFDKLKEDLKELDKKNAELEQQNKYTQKEFNEIY